VGAGGAASKNVTAYTLDHDKYAHILGDVIISDGMHLNQELVKEGWCWWYRKYAPGDVVPEWLEKDSREAKKGLWVDPQTMPPWEWRRLRRSR
jgi:micrococcal nuclease